MLPEFLPFADREIVRYLVESFTKREISLLNGAHVTGISKTGETLEVQFEVEGVKEKVQSGLVLIATGRVPNLSGLEALV
jgi:pyruvate/2-oxoglutarate dehydrogenase complex dihydrolipoamide dehydrogenase (E3) component